MKFARIIDGVVDSITFDPDGEGWLSVPDYVFAGYRRVDGAFVAPEAPPPPVPQSLSFAQFLVGLVEQEWITEAEATAWLSGNSLPAAVEAALATLPETAEDGSKPRLRARALALRPSEILRTNELLLMMAAMKGATPEQLDQFFRTYAGV